jgi:hypothetical protein
MTAALRRVAWLLMPSFVLPGAVTDCFAALPVDTGSARLRVWYERSVAEATGGYDPQRNRTLINRFDMVAWGPNDIKTEVRGYVRQCVQDAAAASVAAFEGSPSPEIGTRIGAAWSAFHTSLHGCLTLRSAAKAYIDKFEIGYIRRAYWIHGLVLKFTTDNPTTQVYNRLQKIVNIPDPLNKVIVFYLRSQQISVNIKLSPPKVLTHFIAHLPDPPDLRRFSENASDAAKKQGKELADSVVYEATHATSTIGREAQKAGNMLIVVPVRLTGEVAQQAGAQAPKLIEKTLPFSVEDGKVVFHPVPGLVDVKPSIHSPCVQVGGKHGFHMGGGCH